jgi:hypothetical protein
MELRDRWDYPESTPSEGNQIIVSYNGDWLPIISGALQKLMSKAIWADAPDDILEEVNDLIYQLGKPVLIPSFPQQVIIFPPQMFVVAGTGLDFIVNTGALFNGLWHRSTPAINDEFSITFPMQTGIYALEYSYAKSSGSGQVRIACNDPDFFATVDHYNATTQLNQIYTHSQQFFVDGDVTLNLKVTGKNGSSSGYVQNWNYIALRKV